MMDDIIQQAQQERDGFLESRKNNFQPTDKGKKHTYSPLLTLSSILAMPDVEEDWLVHSIVINHGITTVSGLPNHFKSFFVQVLVKAVATGEDFLAKFSTQQGAVLIIDREIPTIRLKNRWRAIGAEKVDNIYFYKYSDPFKLDSPHDVKRLEELVDEYKFKLVVIDTFNRSHKGKETNSYSEIAGVLEPLKKLLEKTSIILIHHSNKSGYRNEVPTPDELMGSTDFAAETDTLFTIRKKDSKTLVVHNLKAKDSPLIDPFTLKLTEVDGSLDLTYDGVVERSLTAQDIRENEILSFLKTGKRSKKELVSFMTGRGEKGGTIDNTLTLLRGKGLIDSDLVGKEAHYFLLDNYRNDLDGHFPSSQNLGNGKQGNDQKPCYACGSTKFWRRLDGGLVCNTCHPAPTEDSVKEWVEVEGYED